MMAIHWRTAAIEPNIAALAQAGWDFQMPGKAHTTAVPPGGRALDMDGFWVEWGRSRFGGDAGIEAGRILQNLDGSHPRINALIDAGAQTTDAQISELFGPLRQLETLRPRIRGVGNLERFGYWLNFIRASQLRVRTWVLAARLGAKVKRVSGIQEPDKRRESARQQVLPLRLELARSYEDLIGAFVDCARSPGEVGTISSIESGSRQRIVCSQDAAIESLLGAPLPAEAAVSTSYRAAPRIFVSARCTHVAAGEPQEIRAFALSDSKCRVHLRWRPLGKGAFRSAPATHVGRQAFRVALPAQRRGMAEYYLEATLDNGRRVRWPATAPVLNQTVIAW